MHAEELYAQGYAQLQPPLNESTGVLAGGELSINAGDNTKFDMAAGVYVFVDFTYDPVSPQRTFVPKEAVTAQTVTNIGTQLVTYIGVDVTGTIIQSETPFTDTQRRTIAQVGVLVHSNLTNLNAVNDTAASVRSGISQLHDLITAIGPLNVTGNTVSANGANLNINKSAGSVLKLGCNFQTNPLDPHKITLAALIAPSNLRYRTSTSVETADTAVIDPTQYESSPGVLTPLSSSSKYSVQRLSVFTSNLIRIQWGQHEYGSLAEAENAIPTESFAVEANIAENGIFIGYLIVRKNCTDLSDTADAKFIAVGKFGNPASSGVALTSTDELPEGVVNLYFTDARAQAAVVTASISDGDTTHSPSGDAVFDALALKQPLDATLTGIAALTPTANQGIYASGADTFSTYSLTAGGRALGGVAGTADTFPYFSALNTASLATLTAFARTLLDDTTAAAAATTLGLGTGDSPAFNALTVATTAVIGNTAAIPANTRVLIDRIGTGTLPTLPGGTALTLQGNNATSNNNFLVIIAGTAGSAGVRFGDSGSASQGRIDYDNSTDGFNFYTNATLALSLSSAGVLTASGLSRLPQAINSSSAALQSYFTTGAATPNWQVAGSTAAESFFAVSRFVAAASGPAIFLGHSRGAAPGTQTIVAADDPMGLISFFGSDGTQFREGARIQADVDGTPGTGDMPGRLLFMVSPDGAAAPTEALRLSQNLAALFAGSVTVTGTLAASAAATVGTTLNVSGATTLQTSLVVGDNVAIPSNTRALIDRLGSSPLPALTGGTVLTLAGSVAASSSAFLQLISGNTGTTGLRFGDTDAAQRGSVDYNHNTDTMTIGTAAATAITIDSAQLVTLASVLTGANIYGTYTPTLTAITNVSASSANTSGWIRIGNAVLVFAQISVTATAAGALTVIDISLPVASNFGATTQAVGVGSIFTAGTEVAAISVSANATNDRARATFVSSSVNARTYTLVFGYIVI